VGAVREWKLTTILQPSSVNIGLLSRTHLHSWYKLVGRPEQSTVRNILSPNREADW
jgi:hypothetical protein